MQQQQQQLSHEQQHYQQPGAEEQLSPPLPPTSTHPLYKPGQPKPSNAAGPSNQFNYVASNAEPAKVAFYPPGGPAASANSGNKPQTGNPWEREEREKEQEMRHDQMRLWRDQQIAELSSIPRNAQQEEHLKKLIVERDFERRAQMEAENEEEQEQADGQSVINGSEQGDAPVPPQTLATTMQPKSILKHHNSAANPSPGAMLNDGSGSSGSMGSPSHSNQASPMKQAPKTASFSDQVLTHRHLSFDGTDQMNNNQVLSKLTTEMTHLTMSADGTIEQHQQQQQMYPGQELYPEYPPPPPERNSSYVFMSQQQQKLRTHQQQKQQQMMMAAGGQMMENNNNNASSSGLSNGVAPVATMNGQQQQQAHSYMNGGNGPISPTGGYAANGSNNNNNGNFMIPPPANFNNINNNSSLVRGDNKRVSFHHEEDNNNGGISMTIQQTTTVVEGGYSMTGGEKMMREDPDVSYWR